MKRGQEAKENERERKKRERSGKEAGEIVVRYFTFMTGEEFFCNSRSQVKNKKRGQEHE